MRTGLKNVLANTLARATLVRTTVARATLALAVVASPLVAGRALAEVAPDTATAALKARDAEIRASLPPKGSTLTPAAKKQVEIVLTKLVDLESMAKATLGKHWDAQPPAKQKEFLDTFLQAFRTALGGEVEGYRTSQTEFGAEQKVGELVRVPTTLIIKDEPTEVVYTMKKDATGWRILDITIDEVSTVENYRASFASIIKKHGFDELIARLKKPAK